MKKQKLYILFGYIKNVGGWQIYTAKKVEYLKKNNWEVIVFDLSMTDINDQCVKLEPLKEYQNNIPIEFKKRYHLLFDYQIEKQINSFIKKMNVNVALYDSIVIETTSILFSYWTERLAQKLSARHIIYSVYAHYEYDFVPKFRPYLFFKYKRREIACIASGKMQEMFGDYTIITPENDLFLSAGCMADVVDDGVDYRKACGMTDCDVIIGLFGWLDKFYVENTLREIVLFSQKSYYRVGVVLIGDATEENRDKYQSILNQSDKVVYNFLGSMFPPPSNIFDVMDVCIASSGSARVAYSAGAKTLLMKDNENEPYGIIGYDVFYPNVYSKKTVDKNVSEILNDFLVRNVYSDKEYICRALDTVDTDEIFKKHIDFLENCEPNIEYYGKLKNNPLGVICRRIKSKMKELSNRVKKILRDSPFFGIIKKGKLYKIYKKRKQK